MKNSAPIYHQRSARPGFPAFADRLCVAVHVDLFQLFYAVFYCFAELSYFSLADLNNGQRKGSERTPQSKFPQRGLHLYFGLSLAGRGKADS